MGHEPDLDTPPVSLTDAVQLDPLDGAAYLGQAIEALAREENELALELLSSAIEFSPDLADAHFHRARCHYRFDDCDAALEDVSRAIELDPVAELPRRLRAELYFRVGLAEKAHAEFTYLIETAAHDPIMYHLRGKLEFRRGLYEEAVIDLTAAIELDPKFARALADRALAYRALSKHREALADLTAAVHEDTKFAAEYLVQLGIVRGSVGEFDGAIADFLVALKLDPGNKAAIRGKELVTQLRERHGSSVAGRSFAGKSMLQRTGAWRPVGVSSVSRVAGTPAVSDRPDALDEVIKPHPETDSDEIDLGGSREHVDPEDVLQHIEEPDACGPKTTPLPHATSRSSQSPRTPNPTREEIARQVAHERGSQSISSPAFVP